MMKNNSKQNMLAVLSILCIISFLIILISPVFSQTGYYLTPEGEFREVICGDGICSVGENKHNCPIDCLKVSFNAWLETQSLYLSSNTSFVQRLIIDSYMLDAEEYFIRSSDNLLAVPSQESLTIGSSSSRYIDIEFKLSSLPEADVLKGHIEVFNSEDAEIIPFIINVVKEDVYFATPQIQILSQKYDFVRALTYRLFVFFSREVSGATIRLSLENVGGRTHLLHEFTNVAGSKFEYIDFVMLKDYIERTSRSDEFILTLFVAYDDKAIQTSQAILIEESFFSSIYFKFFLMIGFGLPGAYLLFKVFLFVRKKILLRRRYLLPNLKLLPGRQGTLLKVGKIADTVHSAYLDAADLTTHALVAGSTGSGKSVSASIIVEEALDKKIPVVVFDPTSQWTGLLSSLKDHSILEQYWRFGISEDDTRSYRGVIFTPKNSSFELDFKEYMKPGEATIFNLANLSTVEYDKAVKKIIDKLFGLHWEESSELKLIVVFDEVHRLLNKSTQGLGYSALTKACREFRKWGIGLIMASQVSSDFKEAIGGNVLTEVQLNTKNMEDIKKVAKKYGSDYSKRITRMGIGVALIQNPKYNNAKPWFVHFRPPLHNPHKLTEQELGLYEKYTGELNNIKSKIGKITDESMKEDVLMDYNLAYNKLKEGKFKMADIYLQSLKERLK